MSPKTLVVVFLGMFLSAWLLMRWAIGHAACVSSSDYLRYWGC